MSCPPQCGVIVSKAFAAAVHACSLHTVFPGPKRCLHALGPSHADIQELWRADIRLRLSQERIAVSARCSASRRVRSVYECRQQKHRGKQHQHGSSDSTAWVATAQGLRRPCADGTGRAVSPGELRAGGRGWSHCRRRRRWRRPPLGVMRSWLRRWASRRFWPGRGCGAGGGLCSGRCSPAVVANMKRSWPGCRMPPLMWQWVR